MHGWIAPGLPGGEAALRPRPRTTRDNRRTAVSLGLLAVATGLLGSACDSAEDPTQVYAREAVESYLARDGTYDASNVHCTGNPRPWFVERQATVVICAARRVRGGCDWFRVDLASDGSRVTSKVRLDAPNAGCVLP